MKLITKLIKSLLVLFLLVPLAGCSGTNSSTDDEPAATETTPQETYIGSKAPSAAKAIGDIVFTDGSASPSNAELTDEQKAAAIAVIFDATNKLGVGFEIKRSQKWCTYTAAAYNTDNYAKSESDGKANTDEIAGLEDFNETNYPAFYYCKSYSANGFTSGWYLPAKNELQKLYDNHAAVDKAFIAVGKLAPTQLGSTFYSSSQGTNSTDAYVMTVGQSSCDFYGMTKDQGNTVFAVRAF